MSAKDTVAMEVTPAEKKFIEAIRRQHLVHGRIQCIIYMQDGKLTNGEFEKVIERVKF